MRAPLLFIALLFSTAYAQKASFKEIKLKPNPKVFDTKEATIIYPIIVTANPQADKLMNAQIKDGVLDLEHTKHNARTLLMEHIKEYGLINLSYGVTYNKNAVLSLYVYEEDCGAYCSSGSTYFNFDLKTGKAISIADLITADKLDSFKNIVFHDKLKALQEYKLEEIEELKQGNIDSSTYTWILEEVDSYCSKSVELKKFSLSNGNMDVIDRCELPNAIKSQQPAYELKYSFQFLQPFLKPKFKMIFSR